METKPLFRKNIEPKCHYCKNSRKVKKSMICIKNQNLINESQSCENFQYCPLKRKPIRQKNLLVFIEEDFKI